MAIVTYTSEEMDKLESKSDWARIDALSEEQIERLADEDELEECYGIAANYVFNADGTLTDKGSGQTFARAALLDELTARRVHGGFPAQSRDAAA